MHIFMAIAAFCVLFSFAGVGAAQAQLSDNASDKTLILYYSRSGNTRAACEALQKELGADMIEIKDRNSRDPGFGIIAGMLKTILNLKTDTEPAAVDFTPYRTVIVAAPIWAAKFGLAMRSFVERNRFDGRRVIIFITADVFIEEKYQAKHKALVEKSGGAAAGYFQVQAADPVDGKKKPRSRDMIVAETLQLAPEIRQAIAGTK